MAAAVNDRGAVVKMRASFHDIVGVRLVIVRVKNNS